MEYTFIPRIQKNRENVEFLHSHHHLMCRDRALKFIICHIPNLSLTSLNMDCVSCIDT